MNRVILTSVSMFGRTKLGFPLLAFGPASVEETPVRNVLLRYFMLSGLELT